MGDAPRRSEAPEAASDVVWCDVPCPLCGAAEADLLVTDVVAQAERRYVFRIVRCATCGLAYTRPRGSGAAFGADPGGAARRDAAVANRPVYAAGMARLRALGLPPVGRILDVGCARGDYLAYAAAAGHRVVGVDISPRLAAEAEARGFEVHVGDLRDLDVRRGFDAITLWDVIEHVDDPIGLLATCGARVRPGGLVLFHTGNALFQIPKARLLSAVRPNGGPYLIPYQHLTHFDPATALRALAAARLEPLDVFFAGTLHYREAWKRGAMGALNSVGRLSARLGGPLLTNAMGAVGRRPIA